MLLVILNVKKLLERFTKKISIKKNEKEATVINLIVGLIKKA